MKRFFIVFSVACICITASFLTACSDRENSNSAATSETSEKVSETTLTQTALYSSPEKREGDLLYVDNCLVNVNPQTETENIIIKDGTLEIKASAFAGCNNVKSITVPDSVKIIGDQAFQSCSSLERIYIGSGTEHIGVAPFMYDIEGSPCSNLKSIEISKDNKHYTSVDGVLFNKEMTELIQYPIGKKQKEYVIPDSVTTVGHGAFLYCTELTKLTLGKGLTTIDYCLLFGCDNLETVILPETLTKLDSGAFKCSGIKYIDIPDGVTFLGSETIMYCPRLETVNIGKGVSFIHEQAIDNSVTAVNVDPQNEHFTSENGILFSKDKTEILLYPDGKSGETYHIPKSVKIIKHGAIKQAKNLKKIYVGSGITKIEECNFYESVCDNDGEFMESETNYEIYFDGTEEQWNKLFSDEHEREYIDKTKINFS